MPVVISASPENQNSRLDDFFPNTGLENCQPSVQATNLATTTPSASNPDVRASSEQKTHDSWNTDKPTCFQYDRFDSNSKLFRLLQIEQSNDSSVIRCNLHTCDLSDPLDYVALSYTWDRDNQTKYIECGGKPMRIGRNLWSFLSQFQRSDLAPTTRLWVDAISINQANVGERNHQVAQMRSIYSKATGVIVWLGEEGDNSALAFDFVHCVNKNVLQDDQIPPVQRPSLQQYLALQRLFNRPYFFRGWIIQEFLLAQSINFWCGEHRARADHVEKLFKWLERVPFISRVRDTLNEGSAWRALKLFSYRSTWSVQRGEILIPPSRTLRELLATFSDSECTDIRDKIYALLGIVSDNVESAYPLIADYSKPIVAVLLDVLRNQCPQESYGSLSNDVRVNDFVNDLRKLLHVSWPELSVHGLQYAPELQQHLHHYRFEAHVHTTLRCIGTVDTVVKYCEVDGIELGGSLTEPANDVPNETRPTVLGWVLEAAKLVSSLSRQEKLAFWELNLRHTHFGFRLALGTESPQDIKRILEQSLNNSTINTETSPNISNDGIIERSINLFLCKDGILGATFSNIGAGDKIFADANVPLSDRAFVLRATEPVRYAAKAVGVATISYKAQMSAHQPSTIKDAFETKVPKIETFPRGKARSSLSSRQRRQQSKIYWQEMKKQQAGIEHEHTCRFQCHPTLLADLARLRLLSKVHVPTFPRTIRNGVHTPEADFPIETVRHKDEVEIARQRVSQNGWRRGPPLGLERATDKKEILSNFELGNLHDFQPLLS